MTSEIKSEDQKRKAALALNLCTVSVSQIVDYADINVLKQEYDAILNNLNLQEIIKDEALLNSIKAIMDVITFYIIQEGDKEMADREYQHKMKNAIFDSVSGMGFMVAGDPATMLIGLTTQAGIGYLNYRRSKARSTLEYEKQKWQLQRSAIEQLNGLRRGLFETAWRLSDTYDFPDEWRLTEKQIAKYNQILIDPDPHRQYDRLEALDDIFQAFPSFWYYKSRSALETSVKYESVGKQELCDAFKDKALAALDKYDEAYYPIMREDVIAASAALDKFSLLDPNNDKEQMVSLLERAAKAGESEFDVQQLCAVNYIAIREPEAAIRILRGLVNEQYNTLLNGRLLSRIYNELDMKVEFELLSDRIGQENIMPWADSMDNSVSALLAQDRQRIEEQASTVFSKIFAQQTQPLASEFLSEINAWDKTFSDDKISWKDKVCAGEVLSSWPSRIRESMNSCYNDFPPDEGYQQLFGRDMKDLVARLHELARYQSELIDKLDEQIKLFQEKGGLIKDDTSMLGVPLHSAMKSPKSSLIVEYKTSGHQLTEMALAVLEETFQNSPEFLMKAFSEHTDSINNDEVFDRIGEVLEEKDRSMPLKQICAIDGASGTDGNPNIKTDYFGFILFKDAEISKDPSLTAKLSSVTEMFKKK